MAAKVNILLIHRLMLTPLWHVSGPWAMRDVAQITWALGMLAQPELRYLEACQQAVARRMSQASVVDIINLMWAYAWLGTPPSAPCMQMHTVRISTQSLLLAAPCCHLIS